MYMVCMKTRNSYQLWCCNQISHNWSGYGVTFKRKCQPKNYHHHHQKSILGCRMYFVFFELLNYRRLYIYNVCYVWKLEVLNNMVPQSDYTWLVWVWSYRQEKNPMKHWSNLPQNEKNVVCLLRKNNEIYQNDCCIKYEY